MAEIKTGMIVSYTEPGETKQFRNIFLTLSSSASVNFTKLVETRRAKLIQEGYDVNSVNWELYARVLEAKHRARA
jgi:hypothetical protein